MKNLISLFYLFFIPFFLSAQIGNIGIGKKNPEEKLHVAGNVKVDSLAGQGDRLIIADQSGVLRTINPDEALIFKDASGDVRIIFDPSRGIMEMLHNDTVHFSIQVDENIEPGLARNTRDEQSPNVTTIFTNSGQKIVSDGTNTYTYNNKGTLVAFSGVVDDRRVERKYYDDGEIKEDNSYSMYKYDENLSIEKSHYPNGNVRIWTIHYKNGTIGRWSFNENGKQIEHLLKKEHTFSKYDGDGNLVYTIFINHPEYGNRIVQYGKNTEKHIIMDGNSIHAINNETTQSSETVMEPDQIRCSDESNKSSVTPGEVKTENENFTSTVTPNSFEIKNKTSNQTVKVTSDDDFLSLVAAITRVVGNLTVLGNMSATGTKNFVIDHPLDPENKLLYHHAIESNEVINQYSGNIFTDANGNATIYLPDYFEALNKDFRYHLTPINSFSRVMVSQKIKNNSFNIRTEEPHTEVSWMVSAIRNDKYLQENPPRTVVEKN
jgi:hypothetical protein